MENTFGIDIIPKEDSARVEVLKRYHILDTPSEKSFDHVATLATQIFNVPISLISLVDKEEVYFKANVGMGSAKKTSRGVSLCSLAVLKPEVTIFENALNEPCLLANPNVIGDFGLQFYAGAPLTTHDGFLIGTLCIIDKKPRTFTKQDETVLAGLAKVVMDEIELRLSAIEETHKLKDINEELAAVNEESEAANEELRASNEELCRTQVEIGNLINELRATNNELVSTNIELSSLYNTLKISQNNLTDLNARLTDSEELKNLAIEQAQLGTWYVDPESKEFVASSRLKEFFGYAVDEYMPYTVVIDQIRADYRDSVVSEVNSAIAKGNRYDLEYPILTVSNNRLRWVRATGILNQAINGRKSYLSGTVMDITEQKEDEQRKNDFISMVSHEMKTPLTSMAGYIQVLQVSAKKKEDTFSIKMLDRAYNQTRKMGNLIDGFLNMKRAETGKIPLDLSTFDMADLIRESEQEAIATITSHKVVFAPVERIMVKADREKLGQVITNFINNAVKYSPFGSIINVACIGDGIDAKVSVKDAGIGVNESDKEKLFNRFYRVESRETANVKGFGIGLYLCDEIIKRHDGKIGVESEAGKGSIFYFSIPILK